jgi:hypothetical protein
MQKKITGALAFIFFAIAWAVKISSTGDHEVFVLIGLMWLTISITEFF